MKATYTLIIKATGPHHQGHTTGNLEHDADHQLKSLVQKLQSTGHNVHLATFQIQDGTPEFIVGTAEVPKVEPKPEDPEVKPEEKPAAEQEQQQAGEADPKAPTETAPTQES